MVMKNSEKYSIGFPHFVIEYQVCLLIGGFCQSENNGNCEDQSGKLLKSPACVQYLESKLQL